MVDLLPETRPGVDDDVFEFDGETRAVEVCSMSLRGSCSAAVWRRSPEAISAVNYLQHTLGNDCLMEYASCCWIANKETCPMQETSRYN